MGKFFSFTLYLAIWMPLHAANPVDSLKAAKSEIEARHYREAEVKLQAVDSADLKASSELNYEWLFLQGEIAYRQKRWDASIEWLEKARPYRNFDLAPWGYDTLEMLGAAYVEKAMAQGRSQEEKKLLFAKAEAVFLEASKAYPGKPATLALARFFCTKAKELGDKEAFKKASALLRDHSEITWTFRSDALLLLGESAPTFQERETLFLEWIEVQGLANKDERPGWEALGENSYREAEVQEKKGDLRGASALYQRASEYFEKGQYLLAWATSLIREGSQASLSKSLTLLSQLEQNPENQDFALLLKAEALANLNSPDDQQRAITFLQSKSLQSPLEEKRLFLLGTLLFKAQDYANAELAFAAVKNGELVPESLYWAARASEETKERQGLASFYYQEIYARYPESSYAADGYFGSYSYQDYLLGNKVSLKHLHQFHELFPDSPLRMTVSYLEGLDALRDRRSAEGKWLSRKNITSAIDSFQEVESLFDRLYSEGKFPKESLPDWIFLRYQAVLERAKGNFRIAEEAKGAKRQIYFDYAEEVLSQIVHDFQNLHHLLTSQLAHSFHPIEEEASYYLGLAKMKQNAPDLAKEVFEGMVGKYEKAETSIGYYLALVKYQLGLLAESKGDTKSALALYDQALGAASTPSLLSANETLELLLAKSSALKKQGLLDESMRELSLVINYEAVSTLRLKAMFQRAEIYEEQGRKKLARKQLESLALKGGQWGKLAKDKLEREYGFN